MPRSETSKEKTTLIALGSLKLEFLASKGKPEN